MRAHEKKSIREICDNEIHFREEMIKAQKTLFETNKEPILQQFLEDQVDKCEATLTAVSGLATAVLKVVNREEGE